MNKEPHRDGKIFFEALQKAINYSADPVERSSFAATFHAAIDHVAILLEDAIVAFRRGSFGTSAFLAITSLEETAKAEILLFRMASF